MLHSIKTKKIILSLIFTIPILSHAAPMRYFDDEFNELDADSLSAGFKGHNAAEIYKVLSAKSEFKKSKFESNDDYSQRIKSAQTLKITSKLSLDSRLAFVIDRTDGAEDSFDAEKQIFYVTSARNTTKVTAADMENRMLLDDSAIKGFVWSSKNKVTGNYVASNAFNAKVRGQEIEVNQVLIGLNVDAFHRRLGTESSTDIFGIFDPADTITMTGSEAREAFNNTETLVIGHLTLPFSLAGTDYEEPTIDRPNTFITKASILYLSVEEVWFFNKKTGKVFKKLGHRR
ncbi:hypothetical protein [Undibacterium sp. RuRC25W]|uniref:hypothetical protein n=1 Tax=Undibacterium sp. RuRC25W TaxID=3413047 RepID=UPI003BF065AE